MLFEKVEKRRIITFYFRTRTVDKTLTFFVTLPTLFLITFLFTQQVID